MLLADLILALHLAVVLFNMGGLLLIVTGGLAGWRWIRARSWRGIHLALALFIALEAWIGLTCPLTALEDLLRGEQASQSFVGRLMAAVLYWDAPPWFFIAAYSAYLTAVCASWWKWPPTRTKR
ncbi:MAG: DUF2784 domain-containing protein [Betaproteobacteria bacterium]|nr:DUF2784 domain-containing protein [Betaproteobacteria bacterium]